MAQTTQHWRNYNIFNEWSWFLFIFYSFPWLYEKVFIAKMVWSIREWFVNKGIRTVRAVHILYCMRTVYIVQSWFIHLFDGRAQKRPRKPAVCYTIWICLLAISANSSARLFCFSYSWVRIWEVVRWWATFPRQIDNTRSKRDKSDNDNTYATNRAPNKNDSFNPQQNFLIFFFLKIIFICSIIQRNPNQMSINSD